MKTESAHPIWSDSLLPLSSNESSSWSSQGPALLGLLTFQEKLILWMYNLLLFFTNPNNFIGTQLPFSSQITTSVVPEEWKWEGMLKWCHSLENDYVVCSLGFCNLKYGPLTSSIHITWEHIRIQNLGPQTNWIKVCILMRSLLLVCIRWCLM